MQWWNKGCLVSLHYLEVQQKSDNTLHKKRYEKRKGGEESTLSESGGVEVEGGPLSTYYEEKQGVVNEINSHIYVILPLVHSYTS